MGLHRSTPCSSLARLDAPALFLCTGFQVRLKKAAIFDPIHSFSPNKNKIDLFLFCLYLFRSQIKKTLDIPHFSVLITCYKAETEIQPTKDLLGRKPLIRYRQPDN